MTTTTHLSTQPGTTPTLLPPLTDPEELRDIAPDRLDDLACEIRAFLIDKVCRAGGHLGPNLGMVELTIALHRVFDSPRDILVFDTGHQAYVHKIVTGRQSGFDRLRQYGGMSGYPSRAESEHDVVENSHAGTALSYADGLCRAHALRHEERHVVAVIGDGALTAGIAYEALNNIGGARHPRLVIVLNDNGRSYAPTAGAVAEHLGRLRTGGHSWFEDLNLAYVGPVDGHDVHAVESALRQARSLLRPVVVHCVTVKGRGYPPAEADEKDCLHGIGVVDPATGCPVEPGKPTWTDVFSDEIAHLGARHAEVVCLTAAMMRPVGLHRLATAFPDRVIDTGIAEQHTVTCAAGLAMAGMHPVVCLYATFLNRAFDQLLMDVGLHHLPVTFVLDRSGITGPDGPSHHGMWDLAVLSVVPDLRIAAPRDAAQLRALLREAVAVTDGPTAIRFPKASVTADIPSIGRLDGVDVLHRSPGRSLDVLFVAIGAMAGMALEAACELERGGIGTTVVDPRWLTPVNPALTGLAARHRLVFTVEDGNRVGGIGPAITQACTDAGVRTPVHNLGLASAFIEHGSRSELLATQNLTSQAIVDTALDALAGQNSTTVR
jgi:1-deoxy-D-xylulose-5-phosphate synthase